LQNSKGEGGSGALKRKGKFPPPPYRARQSCGGKECLINSDCGGNMWLEFASSS
jgi:hypothetical protein